MKKSTTMLDGAIVGVKMDVQALEVDAVRQLLVKAGATSSKNEIQLVVHLKSNIVITLRPHYHNNGDWYLNFTGNPLTFITGQNIKGYVEADRVIITAYKRALSIIEDLASTDLDSVLAGPKKKSSTKLRFPQRIIDCLTLRDLNINSIEFATYSTKVESVDQLLRDLHHMYATSYSTTNGLDHQLMTSMLNIRLERQHVSHTSVCLKIMSSDGKEPETQFMAYDKEAETKAKTGVTNGVTKSLRNRLRLELGLQYGWFRRRKTNGRPLKTLADLVTYIETNFDDWQDFVDAQFEAALSRTLMFTMWSLSAHKNPRVYQALLKSRRLMPVTDAQFETAMNTGVLNGVSSHPRWPLLTLVNKE